MRFAVLGANGFIGTRIVEMLHLGGLAEVRPVARRPSGLARSSRFKLDGRVADGFDERALREAFTGCDVVVHTIAGDRKTILGTLRPTYQAAQAAGVRRLIYMSSAAVHGQAPQPGTDERSPLRLGHPIAYNNIRIQAERQLLRLRRTGTVEVVLLRPGIVYGPRSSWITGFADDLLQGGAYLVGSGGGICNSIYVDNLVHAVLCGASAATDGADGQAFLIGDREQVTWADLYRPIANALGYDLTEVHSISSDDRRRLGPDWWDRVHQARDSDAGRRFLSLFPQRLRDAVYSGLGTWHNYLPPVAPGSALSPAPSPTLEMMLLQSCEVRLPSDRARDVLGYDPPVSFEESCRRCIGWLEFAGYPVNGGESAGLERHEH
jgi:nucleoside-diphosphate-sugar epimerase